MLPLSNSSFCSSLAKWPFSGAPASRSYSASQAYQICLLTNSRAGWPTEICIKRGHFPRLVINQCSRREEKTSRQDQPARKNQARRKSQTKCIYIPARHPSSSCRLTSEGVIVVGTAKVVICLRLQSSNIVTTTQKGVMSFDA